MSEIPSPRFAVGQRVRVVLNERNRTAHTGTVRRVVWHHKGRAFNYYLEADGKDVSKRYVEADLKQVDA